MAFHALCPFYEKVWRDTLHCENGEICFPDKTDKVTWLRMHCCSWDFRICKFYRVLMKKYDAD